MEEILNELQFSEEQIVYVSGWMGTNNMKGKILQDCLDSECTALVLFDDCKSAIWIPVEHINPPRESE